MIEAEDEESAKEKVIAQGFSVLSLEEVSAKVRVTRYGFQEVNEDGSFVNPPPEDLEVERSSKTFNKHHFFILFGIMISLLICYFVLVLLPQLQKKDPAEIIAQYFEYGYAGQWQEQFNLLDDDKKNFFKSVTQYELKMKDEWESYPQENIPDEVASEEQIILESELYEIVELELSDLESRFKAFLNYPKEVKELIFILSSDKNTWKISAINDVAKMKKYIERLAEGVRPEIEEKMLSELKQSFGYTDEEIKLKIRQAKIQRIQRLREEEILRRERVEKQRAERAQERAAEVETVESDIVENAPIENDLIQEKLEETLEMVESLGK
jgi:hypothetical protein